MYLYFYLVLSDPGAIFTMPLDQVFEIVIKVIKDNILNKFSLLVLRIEQISDLDDVGAILQHVKHFILPTHSFPDFLNPFESYFSPRTSIDRFKDVT